MGMFGSRGLTASQQVAKGGDGTSMALAKSSGPDWHRIAGIIGDGLSGLAGQPGMYARTLGENRQQQAELQRQLAVAQYQRQNPEPTSMQRNYEYLKGIDPTKAETYLNAQANPQTLMTDPTTGALMFAPKGGMSNTQPGGDSIPTVTDEASFAAIPHGAQFRDPQGNVRVKQ
jgi:hypothetical protein